VASAFFGALDHPAIRIRSLKSPPKNPNRENRAKSRLIVTSWLSLRDFRTRKRPARRLLAIECSRFSASETRWRMTQSDANWSPASNCLLIRENTGNFRDFKAPRYSLQLEKPRLLSGFVKIPYFNRSGNFKMLSGNYFAVSENLPEITGTTAQ
jgi:hypothetical protein